MPLEEIKDEKEEIASLLSDYWQERGMNYNTKWAKDYLTQGHEIETKEDLFFVYKEDDQVIGIVSLIVDVSGVAEIRDLVIKPEHRGKGYGQMILQELEMLAMEHEVRKLFAFILPDSQQLFSDADFDEEGMLQNHFAQGEDLIIMSKFL